MNGIININKPEGLTSHDVVNRIRKLANEKKVGHTGTLDPLASGLLTICLGKATRLFDMIVNYEKEYIAKFKLGIETDTQDSQGVVTNKSEVSKSVEEIKGVINEFVGDLKQIPPMYSAIKKNGKKLYELARNGIVIEREKRNITIFNIDILDIDLNDNVVTIKVKCSKGTYIRTLCHDIGLKLGCFAHMTSLIRTKNGIFDIKQAYSLDFLEEYIKNNNFINLLNPIDSVFKHYKKVIIGQDATERIKNGNIILEKMMDNVENINLEEFVRIYDWKENFLAICSMKIDDNNRRYLKLVKGFYEVQ